MLCLPLQVWCSLAAARAIPIARMQAAMDGAVLRLEDKSSLVRKQALQLTAALMINNPFGSKVQPVIEQQMQLTLLCVAQCHHSQGIVRRGVHQALHHPGRGSSQRGSGWQGGKR